MTGNATENLAQTPMYWDAKYPLARRTELDIADEEGSWQLVSATEVGADV